MIDILILASLLACAIATAFNAASIRILIRKLDENHPKKSIWEAMNEPVKEGSTEHALRDEFIRKFCLK